MSKNTMIHKTAILGQLCQAVKSGDIEGWKALTKRALDDIHDIRKAIVAAALEAHGFKVVNLGRDIPNTVFVTHVRDTPNFDRGSEYQK